MRDSVRVYGGLSQEEVKAAIRGAEEWSSPKLFRHIKVEPGRDGTVLVEIREPGGRWSVTVFTNQRGIWQKSDWYLVEENTTGWVRPEP
jgi:hypothetical protein